MINIIKLHYQLTFFWWHVFQIRIFCFIRAKVVINYNCKIQNKLLYKRGTVDKMIRKTFFLYQECHYCVFYISETRPYDNASRKPNYKLYKKCAMVAVWFIPSYALRGLFSIIILLKWSPDLHSRMDHMSEWQPWCQTPGICSNFTQ